MKIKSSLLGLTLTTFFVSSLIQASTTPDMKSLLQNEVNDYYKTYSKKEKFTAIAASVLIPQSKQNSKAEISTAVAGIMGKPPFTQPITANDLFDIGSITKSFTALLLLQLQTERKLSLDDNLGKWLPQYPNWKEVTLRQLLNMTSGIPSYSADDEFSKVMEADLTKNWTDEELLTYAHPEKPLPTNRRSLYEYCNSNYILAALVIEKVTKDSYVNQLKQRIINARNGFNNTFYPAGPEGREVQKTIANRKLHGYFYNESTAKLYDTFYNDLSWGGAAGAIVANTEDVVQWVQLLYHGLLINPVYREHALAELKSVVSMNTGRAIPTVTEEDPSGFGLGVGYYYDKKSKERFWIYKGSTLGFRVMYFWQPCNDVTTVIALNSKGGEGNPNSKMGDEIMNANMHLYHLIMEHYPELRCAV